MAKFCGQCGSPLNATALFCGGCGAKVAVATASPAPSPAVAPAPFTSAPPITPAPPPDAYEPVASAYTPVDSGWSNVAPPAPQSPSAAADAGDFVPLAFDSPPPPPAPATPAPEVFVPEIPAPQPGGFAPIPGYTPPPADTPPARAYTPPAPAYAANPVAYTSGTAYPAKKSNTLVKVLIALVLILFVGGALAVGGLWYAAVKIKAKAQEVKAQVLGGTAPSTSRGLLGSSSTSDESPGGFKGNPCRFLSNAEVSKAVGLTVIRADAKDGGCSYIAKGDPADVTAKHMSSMLGGMGADAKTQQMAQKFAGALFSQQEATDKSLSAEAATGEIPVLVLSFTAGHAATEMTMNRGAFQYIQGGTTANAANSATGDLAGLGDEAYVAGGSMLMVRKGNTVARFMYTSCPCNTENIKPLARMVVSRL